MMLAKNEERESKTGRLVSFLARSKPKIPFLGLSLLRNPTETLAAQANLALAFIFVGLVQSPKLPSNKAASKQKCHK